MGRRAQGWHLRWHEGCWQVRWVEEGSDGKKRRPEYSTQCRDQKDRRAAEKAAREIYALHVRKGTDGKQRRAVSQSEVLECVARWVASLPGREITRVRYRHYGGVWCKRWTRVSELTDLAVERYLLKELPARVRGKSLRNEGSALRRFLHWLAEEGELPEMPSVPELPSSILGTPAGVRRRTRAPELSPQEVARFIAALPVRSATGWPVRARAIVAHETSLRPWALHRLSAPEHYSKGQSVIRVTDDIDKEGFARELPLSSMARKALDSVCPKQGLIFGRHRLDPYVRAAAEKSKLSPTKAGIICMQHLRSAALTHMGERPKASLAGIQYMAGHKDPHTAARYFRPTFRAAQGCLSGEDSGEPKKPARTKKAKRPRKAA
jgi:integrase